MYASLRTVKVSSRVYAFSMETLEAMAMLNNPEKMAAQMAPYNKDLFTAEEVQYMAKSLLRT